MTRTRGFAFLIPLLLLCIGHVPAWSGETLPKPVRTPGITADAVCGLGAIRSEWTPTPLVLTLKNNTGAPLSGTWVVTEYDGENQPTQHSVSTELTVNANGHKRVHLSLMCKNEPLVAEFRNTQGTVVWSAILPDSNGRVSINTPATLPEPNRLRILHVSPSGQRPLHRPAGSADDNGQSFRLENPFTQAVAVPVWHLPESDAPLTQFHAVVLCPDARLQDLTPLQLKSLQYFANFGGTVIAPSDRVGVIKSLLGSTGPQPSLTSPQTELAEHPLGVGRVVAVPAASWHADTGEIAQPFSSQLLTSLARWRTPFFSPFLAKRADLGSADLPNVRFSLVSIGLLFGIYAFATGPLVWIVFRKKLKRYLPPYIIITICFFSVCAILIGPVLGAQHGDMNWITVTEYHGGSAAAWSLSRLTSSGGRHYEVKAAGDDARIWLMRPDIESYESWRHQDLFSDWSLSRNGMPIQEVMRENPGTLDPLPLQPWQSRLVTASAVTPSAPPVSVTLQERNGTLVLQIRNQSRLLFKHHKLYSCWSEKSTTDYQERDYVNVTTRLSLQPLMPQQRIALNIKADALLTKHHNLGRRIGHCAGAGIAQLPFATTRGTVSIWWVAEVKSSPHLRIEGPFDVAEETHIIVVPVEVPPALAARAILKGKDHDPEDEDAPEP